MTPTITADRTTVVRDRQFSPDGGDEAILRALSHLRAEHVTGTFMVDLACGGTCSLRFREERKVDFPPDSP
jgi:hypothetical protein